MKNYLISYDLNQAGKNYTDLIAAIQTYANARRLLQSVWFIQSSQNSLAIRDHLLLHLDRDDELIVVEMTQSNSSWRLEEKKTNHLQYSL